MRRFCEDPGGDVPLALLVATTLVPDAPTVRVAVEDIDGRTELAAVLSAGAVGTVNERLLSCLLGSPLANVARASSKASRLVSCPLASIAEDVDFEDGSAVVIVLLESVDVSPNCTGQRLHSRRLVSQYISTSIRRNPVASRFDMHLAAVASS